MHGEIVAIAITRIPFGGRVIRSVVLSLKEMSYVEAARGLGASHARMMLRHILPQCVATPSFDPGDDAFGCRDYYRGVARVFGCGHSAANANMGEYVGGLVECRVGAAVVAGVVSWGRRLLWTVLAFNLLGDGIRDALDPRLRGSV